MDKTTTTVLTVLALLVGMACGGMYGLSNAETIYLDKEVEVPVEVSVETLVEVPVSDVSLYLDAAVEDFLSEVDDEELFDCGRHEYDFDEISVSRVYDEYTVSVDDEDVTVDFSVRLKYDEDDERSCRETFDVSVFYEEDEDVEVSIA